MLETQSRANFSPRLKRQRKHGRSKVLLVATRGACGAWGLWAMMGGGMCSESLRKAKRDKGRPRRLGFWRDDQCRMCPGSLREAKRTVMSFMTNRLLNPVVRRLLEWGFWPRTQALLETTGRRSGSPRRVPVGNGLRGNTFWIVTEHGYATDYVRNIQRHPCVRVKVGARWYSGTAQILADDDPRERLRWLRRPVNDALLLAVGTEYLTIRIDLKA